MNQSSIIDKLNAQVHAGSKRLYLTKAERIYFTDHILYPEVRDLYMVRGLSLKHPKWRGVPIYLERKNEKTIIMYRDLTKWQRKIVRTLRKRPNAVVVAGRGWGLSTAIKYLHQRGIKARPRVDRNLSYLADKQLQAVNNSNVIMSRLFR